MTHPDSHPNAFKLSLFIGSWSGSGEVFANPWGPAGTCESLWQFGFDNSGLNLIHDYHESRSTALILMPTAYSILTRQPKKWCGSGLIRWFPPLNPARGNWDTDQLRLTKKTPRGIGRSTFIFAHKYFEYLIETQLNGEQEFRAVMRGEFKKLPHK